MFRHIYVIISEPSFVCPAELHYRCIWFIICRAGIAHLVLQLATGWTVQGSNPGWHEICRTRPDQPWGPPSLLYNGCWVIPGGKVARVWY
jgi:hypothetical protein